MNLYERYVLPRMIDFACGMGAVMKTRAQVVPLAEGKVLEIGIGTGLNLSFYDPAKVSEIVGVDPAVDMSPLARELAASDSNSSIHHAYMTFLPHNDRLLRACTEWQLRPNGADPLAVNEHTDKEWDQRVLTTLSSLSDELSPKTLASTASSAPSPCALSPMQAPPCAKCAACSNRVASCCSANTGWHRTHP